LWCDLVNCAAAQVASIKDRFAITRVVLVGDRGMLAAARLRGDVAPAGLDWITALRAAQVTKLVRGGDLQPTLFDVQDLAEITSPDFPGERLVACMNRAAHQRRRRRPGQPGNRLLLQGVAAPAVWETESPARLLPHPATGRARPHQPAKEPSPQAP
jgi:hypothetical protein